MLAIPDDKLTALIINLNGRTTAINTINRAHRSHSPIVCNARIHDILATNNLKESVTKMKDFLETI